MPGRRPARPRRRALGPALGVALVLVLAAGLGAHPGARAQEGEHATVGAAAPEITAELVVGSDAITLPELRGRVVVVDFWATWCGPCRSIMPALDQLNVMHHDGGLTVLGVAREPISRVRRHLYEAPVSYTIARDTGGTLARYGVRAIPTLVVVDRRGVVREIFVGIEGGETMRRVEALVRTLLDEHP